MRVPQALKKFENEPGIRSYVRLHEQVTREFEKLGATVIATDLLRKQDNRSALRRLFTLERADEADHWLQMDTVIGTRVVRLNAPFRRGLTLPYSLEIHLSTPVDFHASLQRNVMRKPRWVLVPELPGNKGRAAQLDPLDLPAVGWRHDSGGIPVLLSEGGRIGRLAAGQPSPAAWTVLSAHQGFLFNVGPRVQKYVEAAPKLEDCLTRFATEPANP